MEYNKKNKRELKKDKKEMCKYKNRLDYLLAGNTLLIIDYIALISFIYISSLNKQSIFSTTIENSLKTVYLLMILIISLLSIIAFTDTKHKK